MNVETAAELYVHAMAIEREAAERYAEFALRMADQGNGELATVFSRLSAFEQEHLAALKRRTAGVALPALDSDYSWVSAGLVFPVMSPNVVLAVAIEAEKRARAFFTHVQRVAADPALRALSKEMAAEEDEHIALLQDALARARGPLVDWAAAFENPSGHN